MASTRLKLIERPDASVRCALCHDELAPSVARECAACRTRLHVECIATLARCPTLGCAAKVRARRRVRWPFEGDRRSLLQLCAIALPFAFLLLFAFACFPLRRPYVDMLDDPDTASGQTSEPAIEDLSCHVELLRDVVRKELRSRER